MYSVKCEYGICEHSGPDRHATTDK